MREDDHKEAEQVRADERSKRVLDRTAAITLISGIASGYFTMAAEVQGVKRKKRPKMKRREQFRYRFYFAE